MERVAEEAELKRSIIRHYIGNREEVMKALVDTITDVFVKEITANLENLPAQSLLPGLLDILFPESSYAFYGAKVYDLLMDKLLAASDRESYIKGLIAIAFATLNEKITATLARAYPKAPVERCEHVAYTVSCLGEGYLRFLYLGIKSEEHNAALRHFASELFNTLKRD
jgi:AcrR family transcriptional regulator